MFANNSNEMALYWEYLSAAGMSGNNPSRPEYQACAPGPKNAYPFSPSLGFTQANSSRPPTWNASRPEPLTSDQHTTCRSGLYGQFSTSRINGKITRTFVRATHRRRTLSPYDNYKTSAANGKQNNLNDLPQNTNQMDIDY